MSELESAFDEDLSRALRSGISAVPMPDGLLDVPDAWVRPRRRVRLLLGRSLAVASVAVAAVLLALQLGRFVVNQSSAISLDAAASLVGVSARQVLQTDDGFVAIRMDRSQMGHIELFHLAAKDGTMTLLATAEIDPRWLDKDMVSMSAFGLSCGAASGLTQPDYVFGYVQYASAYPDQVTIDAPSSGTWNRGLYVFALDAGAGARWVKIDTHSSARPDLGGKAQLAPTTFDRNDSCSGEQVSQAVDPRGPMPSVFR